MKIQDEEVAYSGMYQLPYEAAEETLLETLKKLTQEIESNPLTQGNEAVQKALVVLRRECAVARISILSH